MESDDNGGHPPSEGHELTVEDVYLELKGLSEQVRELQAERRSSDRSSTLEHDLWNRRVAAAPLLASILVFVGTAIASLNLVSAKMQKADDIISLVASKGDSSDISSATLALGVSHASYVDFLPVVAALALCVATFSFAKALSTREQAAIDIAVAKHTGAKPTLAGWLGRRGTGDK